MQTPLFATAHDLSAIVRAVATARPIQLAVGGPVSTPEIRFLENVEGLQNFTTYLVFDKGRQSVASRAVPQKNGTMKYALDQLNNPRTVVLNCGGLFDGQRLVASQIGTASMEEQSRELYELFVKEIRCKFEKIKSYYVGPEAAELLGKGTRLTPTSKSPETYDLVR